MTARQIDLIELIAGQNQVFGPKPANAAPVSALECPHCKGTGRIPPRTLGERLKSLRAATGLQQHQVAERLGGVISAANLGHVECDRNPNPKLEALRALADFYGVRLGWLIDGGPEE